MGRLAREELQDNQAMLYFNKVIEIFNALKARTQSEAVLEEIIYTYAHEAGQAYDGIATIEIRKAGKKRNLGMKNARKALKEAAKLEYDPTEQLYGAYCLEGWFGEKRKLKGVALLQRLSAEGNNKATASLRKFGYPISADKTIEQEKGEEKKKEKEKEKTKEEEKREKEKQEEADKALINTIIAKS